MQKQILAVLMTGLVVSGGAWAKSDQALLAEAQKNKVSIAQAQKMPDETGVTLTGKIVRQVAPQSDDFELRDSSGTIIIDVDDDLWKPSKLKAGDNVRVLGEVDTHRQKPTDIDVISIEKVK